MGKQEINTDSLVQTLRCKYSEIHSIDLDGESYGKLCNLLDSLSQDTLKALAAARIKWVSSLAKNRVLC